MREAGWRMAGLALHYYCGTGEQSRSATRFAEDDWFALLRRARRMEQLVTRHSQIMDTCDPEKRVALVVDEWGAWHQVEPGTNPGFLYQQNTQRDALVAGLTLNIFNHHCDRVRMANLAQTVNVLQAMILTDKAKILLTPTYHVFEMYSVHHDATLLPADLTCEDYHLGQQQIPALSASALRDKAGKIHVTLCNLNPNAAAEVHCQLQGGRAKPISGRVLTAGEMQAHNTFDAPDTIKPGDFREFTPTADGFTASLPAKSVVVLELE
jgi:alpha-L-arabinofuranosidase